MDPADMEESAEEIAESAERLAEPAEEVAESAEEVAEMTERFAESTEESEEELAEPTKETAVSAEEEAELAEGSAELVEESAESSDEVAELAEEAAESTEEVVEMVEGFAESAGESAEPEESVAKFAEESLESAEGTMEFSDESTESPEESLPLPEAVKCSLCNDTTRDPLIYPLGLFCQVSVNYAAEHSLSAPYSLLLPKDLSLADTTDPSIRITDLMLKKYEYFAWNYLNSISSEYSNFVHVPSGIDVRTCGHYVHFTCFRNYIGLNHYDPGQSLIQPHSFEWSVKQPCPACNVTTHCLLPMVPNVKFQPERLHALNETTDTLSLTNTIDKLIYCGIDEVDSKVYRQLMKKAMNITLCSVRKIMVDGEQTGCMAYKQLCSKFVTLCHKWTNSWRERHCDHPSRIQCSGIGILKSRCERNILSSELCFSQIPYSELLTEHMIYGIRYTADEADVKFAKYEWKKLTLGFDHLSPELLNLDRGFLDFPGSAQLLFGVSPSQFNNRYISDNEDDINIPAVLFDLKTTLIRLSVYVLTSDWLFTDDKKVLLRFIYQMVLIGTIIRTAILAVIRMPLSQVLLALFSTSLSNELFVFVTRTVIKNIMSSERVSSIDVTNFLSCNVVETDYDRALQDACTSLSRLTVQLWHECGIQIYDDNYRIGHETFTNMYYYLTGENDVSLHLIPEVRIERWTDDVMGLFHLQAFRQRLYREPLKWYRFTLVKPSKNYCELFLRSCFRPCQKCHLRSTHQYLCFICGRLLNLDRTCFDIAKSVLIVQDQLGTVWGQLYFHAISDEDRDQTRPVSLTLSEEHFHRLTEDWTLQSFGQTFRNLAELLVD